MKLEYRKMGASLYVNKDKKKLEEVTITKKVEFLETVAVFCFCLGVATILYFTVETLKDKSINLSELNLFTSLSGVFLISAYFSNKWANKELEKLYSKQDI